MRLAIRVSDPEFTKIRLAPTWPVAYGHSSNGFILTGDETMKIWNKPQVREQEVGLEVTSYLPAEIDII